MTRDDNHEFNLSDDLGNCPRKNKRRRVRILRLALAILFSFIVGWRAMPLIWPTIKETVVYPVFPQLQPTPVPTPKPYVPVSNAKTDFDAGISVTDSVIYYFYKDYCPWCSQLTPLTAALPAQINLPNGSRSAVRLVCLNKVEDESLRIITEYYDAHEVPDERRLVPAMVIGDLYLLGGDEIGDQLLEALVAGEGLKTPLLNGTERIP
ncbi:MAG: hypothetical protein IJK28_04775 [Clostridia bacterium]|nr:hypothetical protein [Clostridia bacterium]